MQLVRGQTVVFSKVLKDSSNKIVTPSAPVQARILDPFGNIVAQGTAFQDLESKRYDFRFVVPADAPYSTIDAAWTTDWAFVDDFGQTINIVVDFDVVEDSEELPERSIILSEKTKDTIEFSLPERATALAFEIIDYENRIYFQTSTLTDFQVTPTLKGYVYGLEFDSSVLQVGDYLVRVQAKLPSYRRTYSENVVLRIAPTYFWGYVNSLQTILDKARKPSHLVQSYTLSDMYEYLVRGIAMLNLIPPQTTHWAFEQFPNGMGFFRGLDVSHYLVCAAACYGLQCQIVMYGELGFTFSGQSVTLDHDPTSAIGGEIETLLDQINNHFPKAKELILRSTQGSAFVGVRRMFYNQNLSRIDMLQKAFGGQLGLLNSRVTQKYLML